MDFSPLWISLKVSVIATMVSAFFGILLAWQSLDRKPKAWDYIFESLILLPMVLPPTVTGFLLLKILGARSPVGRLLATLNIRIIFTWQAAVFAAFVVSLPIMYKGVKASLDQLDPAMAESARVMGASESTILLRILLPAARNGVNAALALTFARALGEFGATMMVSGAIAGKTLTIPMALYYAAINGENQTAILWTGLLFSIAMALLIISDGRLIKMLKK